MSEIQEISQNKDSVVLIDNLSEVMDRLQAIRDLLDALWQIAEVDIISKHAINGLIELLGTACGELQTTIDAVEEDNILL